MQTTQYVESTVLSGKWLGKDFFDKYFSLKTVIIPVPVFESGPPQDLQVGLNFSLANMK